MSSYVHTEASVHTHTLHKDIADMSTTTSGEHTCSLSATSAPSSPRAITRVSFSKVFSAELWSASVSSRVNDRASVVWTVNHSGKTSQEELS